MERQLAPPHVDDNQAVDLNALLCVAIVGQLYAMLGNAAESTRHSFKEESVNVVKLNSRLLVFLNQLDSRDEFVVQTHSSHVVK
jgi:hypothetical protein